MNNTKMLRTILFVVGFVYLLSPHPCHSQIPVPSEPQIRWQNYEQTMFVCIDPCVWQGREYDNHTTELNQMKLSRLDTDQWCEVAKSWDAKLILFVAKHTGGFCWWQTNTTDYCVKNIPWKNGKGDVLADLSASCRKYNLDLGVYVYPGDETWGAGIGSGGKTRDPGKQVEYNKVFRQQLTEVLTKYGPVREVWFDGSCIINVKDLLEKYARDAVIFQGPGATLRWVGNESGIGPYPNWYTLRKEDLSTGVATALHSDADGDVYAPVEIDLPLLTNGGHKWFWAPNTDHLLPDTDQLMDVYYRTVGRGGVMLLNSTPDTSGLIPESHVEIYKSFGEEIRNRFKDPIKEKSGSGYEFIIEFEKATLVNHAVIQEDITYGQRIRKYILEGFQNNRWERIYEGTSIGTKKIDHFVSRKISKIRIRIVEAVSEPVIKNVAVYYVPGYQSGYQMDKNNSRPINIGYWDASSFTSTWKDYKIDLTPYLDMIGQYELNFQVVSYDFMEKEWGLEFKNWEIEMYGSIVPNAIEKVDGAWTFLITRSQQTEKMDDFPAVLRVKIRSKAGKTSGNIELKKIVYK